MTKPSLEDLDRCIHGRHSLDDCILCPGGWSTGNLYLEPGVRIGTTLYGNGIFAPGRVERTYPINERAPIRPLNEEE